MEASPLTPVFYAIQFERDPRVAVERIVESVALQRGLSYGVRELMDLIDAELASGQPLKRLDISPFDVSEDKLFEFLNMLRARLAKL
jgi:hypothetical protein